MLPAPGQVLICDFHLFPSSAPQPHNCCKCLGLWDQEEGVRALSPSPGKVWGLCPGGQPLTLVADGLMPAAPCRAISLATAGIPGEDLSGGGGGGMLFHGYCHHPNPRVPWSAGLVQRMLPVEIVLILPQAEDLVLAWVVRGRVC